jgi:hypothetical protein
VHHIRAMATIFVYFMYCSFNDAVSSDYVILNGRTDVEGSSCHIVQSAITAFVCKDLRKAHVLRIVNTGLL